MNWSIADITRCDIVSESRFRVLSTAAKWSANRGIQGPHLKTYLGSLNKGPSIAICCNIPRTFKVFVHEGGDDLPTPLHMFLVGRERRAEAAHFPPSAAKLEEGSIKTAYLRHCQEKLYEKRSSLLLL